MRKRLIPIIVVLILLVGCMGISQPESASHSKHKSLLTEKNQNGELFTSLAPVLTEIDITAIGDLLIHSRVYEDAEVDGGYDFRPMLQSVESYLKSSTITIANQETITGGAEIGLSTYPSFNSPYELADNLKEVGVDLVTMANNHTLDRGEEAIQNAITHYEEIGMKYTGSFKDKEDREKIRVIETDENISVAFLSYTYGTNGIPVPEGKDYLVNLIDEQRIKADVKKAEKLADVTVLSYHFGNEYERMPNGYQKELAQFASDLGVEVVIGHHPHVLQPIDWIEGKNGNQTLVAYSLGNFLSGQDKLYRRIGGIFQFKVEKKVDQKSESIRIHTPAFLPTFVQYEMNGGRMTNFAVLPFHEVTEEQLPDHQVKWDEIKAHMSQWVPDLTILK